MASGKWGHGWTDRQTYSQTDRKWRDRGTDRQSVSQGGLERTGVDVQEDDGGAEGLEGSAVLADSHVSSGLGDGVSVAYKQEQVKSVNQYCEIEKEGRKGMSPEEDMGRIGHWPIACAPSLVSFVFLFVSRRQPARPLMACMALMTVRRRLPFPCWALSFRC